MCCGVLPLAQERISSVGTVIRRELFSSNSVTITNRKLPQWRLEVMVISSYCRTHSLQLGLSSKTVNVRRHSTCSSMETTSHRRTAHPLDRLVEHRSGADRSRGLEKVPDRSVVITEASSLRCLISPGPFLDSQAVHAVLQSCPGAWP